MYNQINPEDSTFRHEIHGILRMVWPLILGQLAQASMGLVDTVMAGLSGTLQLSAVAVGSSFFLPAMFFLVGLTMAIHPIISQLRGKNGLEKAPQKMHATFIVCAVSSVLIALLLSLVHLVYDYVQADRDMIRIATLYLYAVAIGLPAVIVINICRSYCEALGHTLPTLIFGVISLTLNIPLNYIFIFGKLGIPPLGGVGCGISTTVTLYLTAVLFYIYIRKASFCKEHRILIKWYPVHFEDIKEYLKLGIPLALSTTIEVTCFSITALILSPFGPVQVAGHTIAVNVSGLLYLIPLCLSMTATIRTGMFVGSGHIKNCLMVIKTTYGINLIFTIISIVFLVSCREFISSLYTDDQAVRELAGTLLIFCCIYMFPDSIQSIGCGILKGFKEAKTIFIVSFISFWLLAIPLGFILSYGYTPLGELKPYGIWIAFTAALTFASFGYSYRIYQVIKRMHRDMIPHL